MTRLQTIVILLNNQRFAWEYISSFIPSATAVQEKVPASSQQLHRFSEMMASRGLAVGVAGVRYKCRFHLDVFSPALLMYVAPVE